MQDTRAAAPLAPGAAPALPAGPGAAARSRRTFLRRVGQKPMMVGGLVVVVAWVLLAALAPVIAPYDPIDQDVRHRLGPPSAVHWLGVDELGRDVFSRVLYGGRVSLPVAGAVVAVATVFGTVFGGVAGFAGQWFDGLAMRLVDVVLAFPSLILAM
ncbi:MAG: ABC transporter permease, partial [Chloroflexi bacterium]|nr:ABC transporter permease [Chloroflexota bacterium]